MRSKPPQMEERKVKYVTELPAEKNNLKRTFTWYLSIHVPSLSQAIVLSPQASSNPQLIDLLVSIPVYYARV